MANFRESEYTSVQDRASRLHDDVEHRDQEWADLAAQAIVEGRTVPERQDAPLRRR